MLNKLKTIAAHVPVIILGVVLSPYLLWCAWGRIITLKRESRRQDLGLRSSE